MSGAEEKHAKAGAGRSFSFFLFFLPLFWRPGIPDILRRPTFFFFLPAAFRVDFDIRKNTPAEHSRTLFFFFPSFSVQMPKRKIARPSQFSCVPPPMREEGSEQTI